MEAAAFTEFQTAHLDEKALRPAPLRHRFRFAPCVEDSFEDASNVRLLVKGMDYVCISDLDIIIAV